MTREISSSDMLRSDTDIDRFFREIERSKRNGTHEPSDLDAFIGIATGLGMGACLIAVLSIIWCIAN